MRPTIYTTTAHDACALNMATVPLRALPRTGPIAATSLRVARDGAASLVLHLESGEDLSVCRVGRETWADAIGRFNEGTESEET